MPSFRAFYAIFAVTSLAACGGTESNDPPKNEEKDLAAYTPLHRSTSNTANLTCDGAEPTTGPGAASGEELMERLDGIWLRCSSKDSPFDGAAGVEIDMEGRAFSLKRNAAGKLERVTGFANESFFAPQLNGDRWWAYQSRGDGGTYPRSISFSASRNTWKSEFPYGQDMFVRSTEAVEAPPTGKPGARLGEAGCSLPEAGVFPPRPTVEQFKERLQGRWIACGARFHDDAVGFEFAGMDWFALEKDASGALVRSTRADRHGTMHYEINTSPTMYTSEGRMNPTPIAVSTAPVKLQISNYGKGPYVYSALP
ncbi:hypothetical protein LZC95_28565 [Pendulispora brunnea]|uniref:Lipoprotein n=1 Tax=Pendulispora brunnea TaxID=2905690 RepID=A0ABZ2JVC2_9BACT